MSQTPLSFELDPYQIRHYSDSASLAALHTRHQDYLSGWDFPFRVISRSFPADLAPIRTALRHRADDLLDLADVLLLLQQLAAGQAEAADVATAVRQRSTALRRVLGEHPEAARCFRVLEALAQGQAPTNAVAWLYGVAQPLVWRWRWLTNHQVMLDVIEREFPPLALAHHLLIWPERRRDAALFETSLRDRMLLPGVVAAPLPRLFPCRYREQGTLLEPLERGYDYLAILTAYELPPHPWGYDNVWNKLLMQEFPVTLAMDGRTLPRAGLRDKVADVVGVLEVSLTNSAVGTDQRTKEAYESARHVQERVGQQQLHEVAYAVLVGGPTVRVLQERVERVQDQLSGWMRLEQVPGAQRAYAQLFSPTPASQIGAPLVRHPTLSEGLAVKLGWGYRKLRPSGGICWGYELHEGMPLYHDMWGAKGVENAHLMMIGRSGSGKTVALLTLALRHAVAGTQVVFFDPLGKSELLCNAVGPSARYYPVDTSAAINILDPVTPDLKRQRDVVARRISALLGRVLIKGEEVSYIPYELDIFMGGALDGALQDADVYGADGKHLATLTPRDAPLLGNLVDALRRYAKRTRLPEEADAARLLASLIQSKLLGSSRHLFNQPTELAWHFDADVVGYNFAGADRELLPLYYESGFEALNAWVRSDRRKALYRHLLAILDEYRIMASFRELEQYVAFATKAWRNHGAAMWTADQNAITYFRDGDEWSAFTAENVAMTMIGLQEGSGAELLARVYRDRLSPDLLQSIRTASAGQFLLLTGNQAHQIAVELTDLEEEYFLRPVEQPRR